MRCQLSASLLSLLWSTEMRSRKKSAAGQGRAGQGGEAWGTRHAGSERRLMRDHHNADRREVATQAKEE